MGFRTFDRNQTNLLGYSLDDMVDSNTKCRFIVNIVSQLDLVELYNRYSHLGTEANDPSAMLAIWFLGYCEKDQSTKKHPMSKNFKTQNDN